MKQASAKINPLIQAAALDRVRLTEASVVTRISSPHEAQDAEIHIGHEAAVKRPIKAGLFEVTASIVVEIRGKAGEKFHEQPAVAIRAAFELVYSVPVALKATLDDQNAFAKVNSVFQVWPYWREFVQSSFQRMDLPPITLPVFRIIRPEGRAAAAKNVSGSPGGKRVAASKGRNPGRLPRTKLSRS